MKRLALAIFFIASIVCGQTNAPAIPKTTNLDFEDGAAGAAPPGWTTPTRGWEAKIVEGGAASGTNAVQLMRVEGAGVAHPFGNLMQAVDATPYRGRWVRFRAAVRMEGGGDNTAARVQLWMRVDRTQDRGGFFDNMADRPIRSGEWKYFEITGDVADDATTLNFGAIAFSDAKAIIDDVSIADLGKVEVRVDPPKAPTERGLANLIAFTRLFGYVRHFHPSDQAAAANWDRVAIDGVRAVESANNATELATTLESIFRPLAPTVEIYPTGKRSKKTIVPKPPDAQALTWRHRGFGQPGPNIYRSERVKTEPAKAGADPLRPYEADLGGGVSARIPLVVFTGANGTLPVVAAKPPPGSALPVKYTGEDRATRLADVVLSWNLIQHFYPYFDVVKSDWNQVLASTLKRAATDAGEREFLRTLRLMIAAIDDGHGSVFHSSERTSFTVPVLFDQIEGKLVVTHVADKTLDLKPGDVVERIDGRASTEWMKETESMISAATPQWRRAMAMNRLRTGPQGSELRLDVRSSGGEPRSITIARVSMPELEDPRPPKVHEIEPKVFYLDLTRMENADWTAVLPRLADARGVIFDMRGYPRVTEAFLTHLTDKPMQSARWQVPVVTRPDHSAMSEWDESGRWNLQPNTPRITGKVVFLTNGRAISYAESVMGIVEAYRLGEIVGEPTAGTNGNITMVNLPGGYRVVFTGMRVLKHDGSRHHGVGILPTVPVSRTIRGITEGRDEQLERALALMR